MFFSLPQQKMFGVQKYSGACPPSMHPHSVLAFLSDHGVAWRTRRLTHSLHYHHTTPMTDTLEKLAQARGVQRLFGTELVAVDGKNKSAVFKAGRL